jgi:hypothetical protein
MAKKKSPTKFERLFAKRREKEIAEFDAWKAAKAALALAK